MDAYIALGTNLGNKRRNLILAGALLAERGGDVKAMSGFYETEPWGFESDNTFLNAALLLETPLSPLDLLHLTQGIEKEMGRGSKSDGEYHDRVIDIDILLYGGEVIDVPGLAVPHPLMHKRGFVLRPLAEIAPYAVHSILGKNMLELLGEIENKQVD